MEYNSLGAVVEPLCLWYEKNKRSMPWRDDPTPYHVWISEIMLQQTRTETVSGTWMLVMLVARCDMPSVRQDSS